MSCLDLKYTGVFTINLLKKCHGSVIYKIPKIEKIQNLKISCALRLLKLIPITATIFKNVALRIQSFVVPKNSRSSRGEVILF